MRTCNLFSLLSSGRRAAAINIHQACWESEAIGRKESVSNVGIDFSFHLTGRCQPASLSYSKQPKSWPYQISFLPIQALFSFPTSDMTQPEMLFLCTSTSGFLPTVLIVEEVDNLAVFPSFSPKDVAGYKMLKPAFFCLLAWLLLKSLYLTSKGGKQQPRHPAPGFWCSSSQGCLGP